MEAFEKKFGPDHGLTTSGGGNYHQCIRYVWRAALEWALAHDGGECDWDKIEKELEDK